MKKILILFFGFVFSQTITTTLTGLGETQLQMQPSSVSLGGSRMFSTHSSGITLSSPSTLWRTRDTGLSVSASFAEYKNNSAVIQYQQTVNYMAFSFPAGKDRGISFGLTPLTRSNFHIRTSPDDGERVPYGDDVFTAVNYYHTNGGISSFFITYSEKITDDFSFGVTWNNLFGNLFLSDSILTYRVSTNSETGDTQYNLTNLTATQITHYFNGDCFTFEGRFSVGKHTFVLSTNWQRKLDIRTTQFFATTGSETEKKSHLPNAITGLRGGYSVQLSDKLKLVAELSRLTPVKTTADLFGFRNQSQTSVHLGIARQFVNPKMGYWNVFNLSAGAYYQAYEHTLGNYQDMGVTMGMGIEYFNRKNIIDLVVIAGNRTSPFAELSGENYVKVMVAVSTGETWFIKRRRN